MICPVVGVRVVQQNRAASLIRLLKTYRRENDLTARQALAVAIAAAAADLATFDEFDPRPLPKWSAP